ncbi:MAG TPA: cysteine--tRNA ligase, partial [Ruminococcus sp.]|nr:cysteine--tRNA ligase [Ruminococcus sp.]
AAYEKILDKIIPLLSENNSSEINQPEYDRLMKIFCDALDNDLNTAMAVTAVYDVLKSDADSFTKLELIRKFDEVLGLDMIENARKKSDDAKNDSDNIPQEILDLAEQRKQAKKDKNFTLADEIRNKISELGYNIKDTRQGTEITKK